ncbi:MAG: helix-turn-helix transcriptional regulator [Eubacterium sp.]|jgi:Predicted transcriptional regulators|nr:helix-turn-helix transcriptional regulator [Eubacterium sp.]
MTFGERLEKLCTQNNLTKTQLANELHISASTLSGYLHNRREPDYQTLTAFADFFNVSIDYLLGRTEYTKPLSDSLTPEEGELLGTYRTLGKNGKNLLVQQAHLYATHLDN